MKKFFIAAFLFFPALVFGSAKDLVKYIPSDSFTVIGADFIPLRANAIFISLEQSGKVWSDPKESDLTGYFKILNIDPRRDVKTFLFSKYLNSYGSKGDLRIFEFTREISLPKEGSMKYLNAQLYRIDPDLDVYAAQVSPKMLALGDLNEAKMAVDLAEGKSPSLAQNASLFALLSKVPEPSAVWGLAIPLSQKEASAQKGERRESPILGAFHDYYFYGIPEKNRIKTHFYGQAVNEKEALFVNTFAIGILTYSKLRVDEKVADDLDQINIEKNGTMIHASGVVTQSLVDAYLKGDLGVE
jgi:hypothetical protein